jgi:hypothetical protein
MMTEDMTYVEGVSEETGRNNKVLIIVAIVIVVLCCCLTVIAVGAWWLWNNGDELFGLTAQMMNMIA